MRSQYWFFLFACMLGVFLFSTFSEVCIFFAGFQQLDLDVLGMIFFSHIWGLLSFLDLGFHWFYQIYIYFCFSSYAFFWISNYTHFKSLDIVIYIPEISSFLLKIFCFNLNGCCLQPFDCFTTVAIIFIIPVFKTLSANLIISVLSGSVYIKSFLLISL